MENAISTRREPNSGRRVLGGKVMKLILIGVIIMAVALYFGIRIERRLLKRARDNHEEDRGSRP